MTKRTIEPDVPSVWFRPIPMPGGVSVRGYLRDLHPEERRRLVRSLCVCILAPLLTAIFLGPIAGVLEELFWLVLVWLLPFPILMLTLARWATSEDPLWVALGRVLRPLVGTIPLGSDLKLRRFPWLTAGLIYTNTVLFLGAAEPYDYAFNTQSPTLFTNFSAMFMHADLSHLLGNMLFLWVFGSTLEGRIGSRRFFIYYLLCGSVANGLSIVGYEWIMFSGSQGVGASGAIAGVMGLFMVRCYFARVSVAVPLFAPLIAAGAFIPVAIRIRVNAVVLLFVWFIRNLAGTVEGAASTVDYWAHVGGFFWGLVLAYGTGLFAQGLRERLLIDGLSAEGGSSVSSTARNFDTLLEMDAENLEALLGRARRHSKYALASTAADDYAKVIRLLLKQNRRRAAEVYAEYFRKYRRPLSTRDQLMLAPLLVAMGEQEIAARSFELLAMDPSTSVADRQKALIQEAKLLTGMGLPEVAVHVYEAFLRDYPDGPSTEATCEKLANLRASHA